jgi:hypothetical protein
MADWRDWRNKRTDARSTVGNDWQFERLFCGFTHNDDGTL